MTDRAQRRLAAIVSADVAGYSRLMGREERGTLATLKAHRAELIDDAIASHGGRIVKTTGDGMLAEFPSVVDAVECCVAVQEGMARRNADVADDTAIQFRIGIHLGDIIVDGDDIFGDGVNVAARLQEIGEPGGIAVSAIVHDYLDGALASGFVDQGERELKNIRRPIRVWQRAGEFGAVRPPIVRPAPPMRPDKPSIAVLPFQNMSGDLEQEYFADGISEDIITVLSKFRTFSVCARNSTFVYKGKAVDIRQLASELGMHYVVEGSVRKAGNRVRITAQLIDARTGNHVWAERYDRELEDIFAVQDEITESVVSALSPEVMLAEIQRAQLKEVDSLDTWDRIMRARWHLFRFSEADNRETKRLLTDATTQNPTSAVAWSDLAWSHLFDFSFGWSDSAEVSMVHAADAAQQAVMLDPRDARAHTLLGVVDLFSARHDDAVAHVKHAIGLNPNDPLAHGYLGLIHAFAGDSEAAFSCVETAIRLSPRDPFMILWLMAGSWACFVDEEMSKCLEWIAKAKQENPNFPDVYTLTAAAEALLGHAGSARTAAEELMRRLPDLTLGDNRLYRPFKRDFDRERLFAGLSKAGVPA